VQTSTIEEIIATLRQLAQWSPQPEKAQQAAQAMQQEYDALKALCQRAEETRLPAVRRRTAIHQRPRLDSGSGAEAVRRREYLCRQPGSLAAGEPRTGAGPPAAGDCGDRRRQPHPEAQRFWQHQLKISLIALHSDWFERASPRIILAAKQLCAALDQVK
jgi:vitamin B12 transport system substrate-binding protein